MEFYILDPEINIIDSFKVYEAVIWETKFHEPGSFKATFVFTEKLNRMLQIGNILYKTDEIEPGIITYKIMKTDAKGNETIQVQGYMASRYLSQRIIWGKMVMKGTPELMMRQMVLDQVIAPDDEDRKMSLIRLGEIHNFNLDSIEKQISYDNLLTALTDLSKTSGIGFRLRLDMKERLFYFETYMGKDRTQGTVEPCIFSRDFGNVSTQNYEKNAKNYKNVCLIGGKGEDEERIMQTVGAGKGIDRYEMFYNGSSISDRDITDQEYLEQLKTKGNEKLASYAMAECFSNKINMNKSMFFELGDMVTCVDDKWGIILNTQVKGIQKGFSKKESSVVVTFGDDVPTLISLIKAQY